TSNFFAGVAGVQRGPADPNRQLNPVGVFGFSANGEGVHGETTSDNFAAVSGINRGPGVTDPQGNRRKQSGGFGKSENGEGVHGETNSDFFAGVVGLSRNPNSTSPGIFGKSDGRGPAAFFEGNVTVTRVLTVNGDIVLQNADCAEEF